MQRALVDPDVDREAPVLLVVGDEVLDRGLDGDAPGCRWISGDHHPRLQQRILAERLEGPAAARRTRDVDRRRQLNVVAGGEGLGAENDRRIDPASSGSQVAASAIGAGSAVLRPPLTVRSLTRDPAGPSAIVSAGMPSRSMGAL